MNSQIKSFGAILGALVALGIAGAGCSSLEVQTARAPYTNLSQYKTYAWAPEVQSGANKPAASVLDQTIKATLEQQLGTVGLTKTDPQNADLLVGYNASTRDAGVWGWDYPYYERLGTLTVVMVDPKTNKAVWQGSATDVLNDGGASQKQIVDGIHEIVKRYPVA